MSMHARVWFAYWWPDFGWPLWSMIGLMGRSFECRFQCRILESYVVKLVICQIFAVSRVRVSRKPVITWPIQKRPLPCEFVLVLVSQ